MSCRLVLAVFCVALALTQAKFDKEKAKVNFDKCKEETGATETFDEFFKEKKIPTSDKGMCLVDCLMKKKDIYDSEGKFNAEAAKIYFNEILDGKTDDVDKSVAIALECSKIDVEGLDHCEAAVKRLTCGKTRAAQEKISFHYE